MDSPEPIQIWLMCLLLTFFIAGFIFRSDGGINLDTIMYVQNAELLPTLSTNIFPYGYSIALKIIHLFLNDYFWSSKVLNFLCLVFIVGFSWFRQFYFTETLLVLCLKIGIGLWSFSYSEPLFLCLLYGQFYLMHQYFEGKFLHSSWPIKMAGLMVALLLVRHTGIFIFVAYIAFFIFFISAQGISILKGAYFKFLISSALLICLYLSWNWLTFHSFFGENYRGTPDINTHEEFINHLILNFKGAFTSWNPFYTIVFQHNDNPEYSPIEWGIFLTDIFWALAFCWFCFIKFKSHITHFHFLLLSKGFIFLIFLFFSSLYSGIEILNNRLLAPVGFCFFFSFLILYLKTYPNHKYICLKIAFLPLIFNFIFLIKHPSNYLRIRAKAIQLLEKHPKAKFFLIDMDDNPETIYHIPYFGGEFRYKHTVNKSGYINRNALFVLKPFLSEIGKQELWMNKKEIILNSEMEQ